VGDIVFVTFCNEYGNGNVTKNEMMTTTDENREQYKQMGKLAATTDNVK
jgi:hypothetical protein